MALYLEFAKHGKHGREELKDATFIAFVKQWRHANSNARISWREPLKRSERPNEEKKDRLYGSQAASAHAAKLVSLFQTLFDQLYEIQWRSIFRKKRAVTESAIPTTIVTKREGERPASAVNDLSKPHYRSRFEGRAPQLSALISRALQFLRNMIQRCRFCQKPKVRHH